MATTFTLSGGDIPRPYRKCRIEYFREAASQTFVKGDILILQTTADKGDQVKISGADPSSGTVVGIAAEDASGTENTQVGVYVLDQAVRGTYSVRTTDPAAHPAEHAEPDGAKDEIPQQMTDALLMGEDASMLGGEP